MQKTYIYTGGQKSGIVICEVKLTFEMLTARGQQHSFSTHERCSCDSVKGFETENVSTWSLGMGKWSHPTLERACDYSSMLGLKLNHVSKMGPRGHVATSCVYVICYILYTASPSVSTLLEIKVFTPPFEALKSISDRILCFQWAEIDMKCTYECSPSNPTLSFQLVLPNPRTLP